MRHLEERSASSTVQARGLMPRVSSLTGFTLIEMLVVMAAVAIFTTMAVVAFSATRARQRDAQRMANMDQLAKAMEFYLHSNGKYPVTACNGAEVSTCLDLSPFLPTISSLEDPSKPTLPCDPDPFAAPCEYVFGPMSDDDYVVYFARENKMSPSDPNLCYKLNPGGVSPCS